MTTNGKHDAYFIKIVAYIHDQADGRTGKLLDM